ncbi:VanZ family protein [Salinisphaera sp. P385]|uniref:VanZ family protein n=1 Tax=Spectribacter acetivorans TaxID=3075603 RepID=A0ABU3B378_9GAMM|nr:VanZ family protein [Salinisphaera sp. P385]MDT0616911.1 VanZ family protein [Salinisphaera sp. P385]
MNDTDRPGAFWWWLGLAGCGLLLVLALAPGTPGPSFTYGDKVGHLAAFALLGGWFGALRRDALPWIGLALLAYGGLIELLQGLTPSRLPEWGDLLADLAGIVLGILLLSTGMQRVMVGLERGLSERRRR